MFGDGALTFREFAIREPLPLATVHDAVLEFLRGRDDAALFGAQAVNAYVDEPRMMQDVDILSPRAAELAEELRGWLSDRFRINAQIRELRDGFGCRIDQVQEWRNRHLVDLRPVDVLPPTQTVTGVLVIAPVELIVQKLATFRYRRGRPKAGTDWRDLAVLLLTFPDLKVNYGPVRDRLEAMSTDRVLLADWEELVAQEIHAEAEDDKLLCGSRQ